MSNVTTMLSLKHSYNSVHLVHSMPPHLSPSATLATGICTCRNKYWSRLMNTKINFGNKEVF